MRIRIFSQDSYSHAVIIGNSVPSSVVRGVRVRTSMCTKWHDPKLVLITDLQQKERNRNGLQRMFVCSVFLLGHGWMILAFASPRNHSEFSQNGKWKGFNYYTKSLSTHYLFVAIPSIHHDGCLNRCINSGRPNRVIPQQVFFSVSR